MKHITIRNRTKGTIVARDAALATGFLARLRGLIGRRNLSPGEGMIIKPCSSIHTCFMAFPIEVLFVDAGNQVLRATTPIEAWRIGPIVSGASYVVELPAGSVAASQTTSGDILEWEPGEVGAS